MLKSIIFLLVFIVASIAHVGTPDDIHVSVKNRTLQGIYSVVLFDTPSATAQIQIISKYAEMEPNTHEVTLTTVPARKVVVITDILVSPGKFALYENTTLKISLDGSFMRDYHFASGIPFSSGTNINIKSPTPSYKHIFISGWEGNQ